MCNFKQTGDCAMYNLKLTDNCAMCSLKLADEIAIFLYNFMQTDCTMISLIQTRDCVIYII